MAWPFTPDVGRPNNMVLAVPFKSPKTHAAAHRFQREGFGFGGVMTPLSQTPNEFEVWGGSYLSLLPKPQTSLRFFGRRGGVTPPPQTSLGFGFAPSPPT